MAEVPFVDVVTTMLDDSLPLTVAEWEEWGDPRKPERVRLPRGLLAVREHARAAARGRCSSLPAATILGSRCTSPPSGSRGSVRRRPGRRAPSAPLFLRTALGGAAHTGPAGRYDAWRHEAFLHAFVLDAIGCCRLIALTGRRSVSRRRRRARHRRAAAPRTGRPTIPRGARRGGAGPGAPVGVLRSATGGNGSAASRPASRSSSSASDETSASRWRVSPPTAKPLRYHEHVLAELAGALVLAQPGGHQTGVPAHHVGDLAERRAGLVR